MYVKIGSSMIESIILNIEISGCMNLSECCILNELLRTFFVSYLFEAILLHEKTSKLASSVRQEPVLRPLIDSVFYLHQE